MATQLKHADYSYRPPVPRPSIRVAFIAGEAANAISRAKLPDATLEELSIRADTEALIVEARKLLSPRMYDAFLRWSEAAIRTTTLNDDQDEAVEESTTATDEVRRVSTTDAQNVHDTMFKTYLLGLEAADCPPFGPLRICPQHASGYVIESAVTGLTDDLAFFSPVCRMTNELADRAWDLSNSRLAITREIGAAMVAAFHDARAGIPIPSTMDGYDRFMRGPLIQWEKAYARYEQASADLTAFDRAVHTPAERKCSALGKQIESGSTDPHVLAAYDSAAADLDTAQERYDVFVSARGDTIDALLSIPAPSPAELAVKLKLYSHAYGWVCSDPSVGEKITADARRFGRHGAYLKTDQRLLEAYADRRRTFEGSSHGKTTDAEDNAYFARLDACDDTLLTTRATTIEGVIAKMRVAFLNGVGEAWSDLATSDPSAPAFVDGLRTSDLYTRLAWSAIEDLARIGGVSLAEQGR